MRVRKPGLRRALPLALLLGVAISVPAFAQSSAATVKTEYPTCNREISKAETDAAHTKYLSGKVDYDEGKYDLAIANFRASYDKDCTKHELLVIISRSFELNNNLAEAIRALEVYLDRQPSSPDAVTHKTRIASMKDKLAQQQKAAASATVVPTATGGKGGGGAGGESSGHTIYPWLVVVGGVLAASIGVTLFVAKPDTGCDLSEQTCERKPNEDDRDYKRRQEDAGRERGWGIAGPILMAGGGAMIVGGLVWYFLEPTGPKDAATTKSPRVQPQLGPGYGGFALTGRF